MNPIANWNGCEIHLVRGNITLIDVDAIVSSANPGMGSGGGVSGAIHSLAGPAFTEECRSVLSAYGMIPAGGALITGGGLLRARHVIHAVAPKLRDESRGADDLLAMCYFRSLELARKNYLRSIAFPCLGTGTYGFPQERASRIAVHTVRFNVDRLGGIDKVVFCVFEPSDFKLYESNLSQAVTPLPQPVP